MRLVAGAARYLGLSVISRRYRTVNSQGKKIVTRMYTFSGTRTPISDAIKSSQIYPGTQPVEVKHIYDCVSKRLEQLATYQSVRLETWQNPQVLTPQQLAVKIHIDNFASINTINLPKHLRGSPEFTLENLRSVAQTLLEIGQMESIDLESTLNDYFAVINPEVAQIALEMVESKYPQVFERLKRTG
jgi:hypothetical protein